MQSIFHRVRLDILFNLNSWIFNMNLIIVISTFALLSLSCKGSPTGVIESLHPHAAEQQINNGCPPRAICNKQLQAAEQTYPFCLPPPLCQRFPAWPCCSTLAVSANEKKDEKLQSAQQSVGGCLPFPLCVRENALCCPQRPPISNKATNQEGDLDELLAITQEEKAKAAIVCTEHPLPICKSFAEPALCCRQPKIVCDICELSGLKGCCPKPRFPVLADKTPTTNIYQQTLEQLGKLLASKQDGEDTEAKTAFVCQTDDWGNLPICKSPQSSPICCVQPKVVCDLCRSLGFKNCCPPSPPFPVIG